MIDMLARQSHCYFAYVHVVQADPAYFVLELVLGLLVQLSENELMEDFLGHF